MKAKERDRWVLSHQRGVDPVSPPWQRTLADMAPAEVAAIEAHYGARIATGERPVRKRRINWYLWPKSRTKT